jgi:hypothetical protein
MVGAVELGVLDGFTPNQDTRGGFVATAVRELKELIREGAVLVEE